MGVKVVSAWLVVLGVTVVACTTLDSTTSTTPPSAADTSLAVTTAATTATSTSVPEDPDGRTRLQLVNPATLEPAASPVVIPGYLSPEHAMLPDGRLVLFSWDGHDYREGLLTLLDPGSGGLETIPTPFGPEVRVLGYSSAMEQVVLLEQVGGSQPTFFDPASQTFVSEPFNDLSGSQISIPMVWEAALFDGGRKLALYLATGYDVERIGEPPTVRVADLENGVLGEPIEVKGAVHGLVELPPDMVPNPDWPYGEIAPGIAFDVVDGRLFVVHADGAGLTVVDLMAASTEVVSLGRQPSFWTRALSWLIPPAEAKGSDPSATLSAWLSDDRSQLLVTGAANNDTWREPATGTLHPSNSPLGLTVIDTETLDVVAALDLPVTQGVSTKDAIALGGTFSKVFCDQMCDSANNYPEIEGEPQHAGLYVLDPVTLAVRSHHRPGANFHTFGTFEHWLVTQGFGADGDYHESTDLTTGTHVARIGFSTSFFVITDRGVLEAKYLD